ncbi:MAG: hypothetical protein WC621_00900 [Patescibacteria group bacterium]
MLLDIVILPPSEVRKKVGRIIPKSVTKRMTLVVDNKKFIPHISLFHLKTNKAGLLEVIKATEEVIKDCRPLVFRSLNYSASNRWLTLFLSNSKHLKKLNTEIINKCFLLRTGTMPWTEDYPPTKQAINNRKRLGNNGGRSFKSHFTIGVAKSAVDAKEIVDVLKPVKMKFISNQIAVCEVNFWHQVTKVLKKFKI